MGLWRQSSEKMRINRSEESLEAIKYGIGWGTMSCRKSTFCWSLGEEKHYWQNNRAPAWCQMSHTEKEMAAVNRTERCSLSVCVQSYYYMPTLLLSVVPAGGQLTETAMKLSGTSAVY
jgi:hypothetical protein